MDPVSTMPRSGLPREEVLRRLREFGGDDPDFRSGRTWSLVYRLDDDHTRFLEQAHAMYMSENALNPTAFRSLKRMESDVVRMTASLLNGGPRSCGTMTSGGTESCLLAVKTYRDMARRRKRWLGTPEVVVPRSVHVAFEKAAHYFGVKLVHAPLGPDFRADPAAIRRRLSRRTAAVVASAPCYPFGVVDPIPEIAEVAARRGIPVHVDACLGGFLLPFVERLGRPIAPFDFRVPGVTSMSADVHKYGFSAKGASVLVYRDVEVLRHQMFVYEDWPGGVFASPGILGTRSGGPMAAAWAALMALGEDGYLDIARTIMDTTQGLVDGISSIPGLEVLGRPDMSVFAYGSIDPALSIYAVGDRMSSRGWHVDRNQAPECLHAMVTPRHAGVADSYLADLRASVDDVRRDPDLALRGGAAMYGMIAHVPIRGLVRDAVMKMMLDMYGPEGRFPDPSSDQPPAGLAERAARRFLAERRRLEPWIAKLRPRGR